MDFKQMYEKQCSIFKRFEELKEFSRMMTSKYDVWTSNFILEPEYYILDYDYQRVVFFEPYYEGEGERAYIDFVYFQDNWKEQYMKNIVEVGLENKKKQEEAIKAYKRKEYLRLKAEFEGE